MRTRSDPLSVVVYGAGAMGLGAASMIHDTAGMRIVGAINRASESGKVGQQLDDLTDRETATGVTVSADAEAVLRETTPDVVVYATSAWTAAEMAPDVCAILEAGADVVSPNVGLFYPDRTEQSVAEEVDAVAKENGGSVLCTGVNPGFLLDTLVVALTGVCQEIDSIAGTRTVDFSALGPGSLEHEGIGVPEDEWYARRDRGDLTGHDCFDMQIRFVADAIGLELDAVREASFEPIVAAEKRPLQSAPGAIEPGETAGIDHVWEGVRDGEAVITLRFNGAVQPETDDLSVRDRILIEGTPGVDLRIDPGLDGAVATWAMVVNTIPDVVNAKPGLVTMADVPIPAAILSDARDFLAGGR